MDPSHGYISSSPNQEKKQTPIKSKCVQSFHLEQTPFQKPE